MAGQITLLSVISTLFSVSSKTLMKEILFFVWIVGIDAKMLMLRKFKCFSHLGIFVVMIDQSPPHFLKYLNSGAPIVPKFMRVFLHHSNQLAKT